VDVGAAVVADEQSFELVQPGEGAFDDPAVASKAGAVLAVAARDFGLDPALAELATAAWIVVGAVAGDALGTSPRRSDLATYGRDAVEQRDQLGAVVAVAAGQSPGEREARRRRPGDDAWSRSWLDQPGSGPSRSPFSPARGCRRRPHAPSRAHQRRASGRAATRAAAPRRPPSATRPSAASRSLPSRTPTRQADASTRSPCTARTRSPAAPADPAAAGGPESGTAAASPAATAPPTLTARPKRSTAQRPSAPLPA